MRFKSKMQMYMVIGCWSSFAVAVICFFFRDISAVYSIGVTALTFFTHFMLRFIAAFIVNLFPEKCFDYRKKRFQPKKWERSLYKALGVRKLKGRVPTYDPAQFDFELLSVEQIIYNGCHAETVHLLIALMSFLPLLYTLIFGSFPVFLITSLLAAGFDLVFVVVQRYNRPRLLKLLNRKNNTQEA